MSRVLLLLFLGTSLLGPTPLRANPAGASEVASGGERIPLPPRPQDQSDRSIDNRPQPSNRPATTTMVGGLAVCLGLFFLFVWATKRNSPSGSANLPSEVVEVLGRKPLGNRQHLQLVRVGHKLVLLNVTPTEARPLTEVTDASEVDRLLGLCQQGRPNSVTASFREVLSEYEAEPAAQGFLGNSRQSDFELATGGSRRRPLRRERSDA